MKFVYDRLDLVLYNEVTVVCNKLKKEIKSYQFKIHIEAPIFEVSFTRRGAYVYPPRHPHVSSLECTHTSVLKSPQLQMSNAHGMCPRNALYSLGTIHTVHRPGYYHSRVE